MEIEKKDIRIGKKVLTENDLKFPVTYNGEVFTLRYPTPFEIAAIEAEIVRRLGGYARNTFSETHLVMVESTSYVDRLVIREESPAWFKSAWTCYDDECVRMLYQAYFRFRNQFQDRLREDDPEGTGRRGKS